MKKNITLIAGIVLIVLLLIFIAFILKSTFFYNYQSKLSNYLNEYFEINENNIDNINKLINRYTNNEKKKENIYNKTVEFVDNKVNEFNKNYENVEDLSNTKDKLNDKINFLIDNIDIDIKEKKDGFITSLNNLYESKYNYLNGINYLNNNDYNNAYDYLNKVIKSDSYFDEVNKKIDEIFESEISNIEEKIKQEKNNISEDSLKNINIYNNILNILKEEKDNTKFDITKSKKFTLLVEEAINNLLDLYESSAKAYANNNNYDKAIETLANGIKVITSFSYSADKLITLKDEYDKMMPVSLTKVEKETEGSSIKEEMIVVDTNNKSYPTAISIYKSGKSSITYKLNKEYTKLNASVSIGKEVNEKKKNYGRVKIYADNKVIYDSKDITKSFSTKNIDLDVKDINSLKIEYTNSSSKSSSKDNILTLIIGNPTLKKY